MTKFALFLSVLAGTLGLGQYANAQIFGSVSNTGSVVLSNIASDEVHTVIVSDSVTPAITANVSLTSQAVTWPEAFQSFVLEASIASRLPAELIHAVIKTESNYNPKARSIKGAQGLMQLMPATAKRFGSTNSLDPRDNILAGARYLRWLMDYFNQNIELAVAAYNAGEGSVVKAGNKIPPYLETRKYVPKVIERYRLAAGLG